ncbi:hypothetical protein D3C81_2195340 [compost metagenome]
MLRLLLASAETRRPKRSEPMASAAPLGKAFFSPSRSAQKAPASGNVTPPFKLPVLIPH